MSHLLQITILTLLILMGGNCCMASGNNQSMTFTDDGIEIDFKLCNNDRLTDLSNPEQPSTEALFSDMGSNAHRICNSKPQRLLPNSFARTVKSAARASYTHYSNHLNPFYGRKSGRHKAPLLLLVSDDYFIVLRHIIR